MLVAWRDLLSHSAMMTKGKGEKGSPYLIPLEGEKGLKGEPLIIIEKKDLETKAMIRSMKSWWNPKVMMTSHIYSHMIFQMFSTCKIASS